MKKTIVLALAIVVGAICNGAQAAKKKKKDKAEPKQELTLATSSDTLSYVAGMALTNGLIAFLQQSENFDTTYLADFIRGFEQVAAGASDPHAMAFASGVGIGTRVCSQMMPSMKNEFTNTPDSLVPTLVYRGFADALRADTTLFEQAEAEQLFSTMRQANIDAKNEKLYGQNRINGERFMAENAKKDSVVTLPSGLQYKVIKTGTGAKPNANDRVEVVYEGRLIDGTVFDSSKRHGQRTATFRVDQVIKGWTEALTMMPAGSKWQLFIPQELAYGSRDAGQIKPFSALIFDVELVKVIPHKEVVNPYDPRKGTN